MAAGRLGLWLTLPFLAGGLALRAFALFMLA